MKVLRIFIAAILFFSAGIISAQEKTIHQVKKGTIKIDGNLEEWPINDWFQISFDISGAPYEPSPNLDVKACFAFDTENLYLAVRALDDVFETVDRSWRYGDGFFFTLVTEEGKEKSSYVYQYGFAQKQKFLVFGNGEYFPRFDSSDIQLKLKRLSERVDYEIAILLKLLKPFNPFIYEKVALNLIYTDRDRGHRTSIMLLPDRNYDTESTDQRRGTFFDLAPFEPTAITENSYHSTLKKNFFKTGETINTKYALHLKEQQHQWKLKVNLAHDNKEMQLEEQKSDFQRGLNQGNLTLKIGNLLSGDYELQFAVFDDDEKEVYRYSDGIFILNAAEIERSQKRIAEFKDNKNISLSLSNLEIRFEWFDDFYMRENYEDISSLDEWKEEIVELVSKLEKGRQAVFDHGIIKRYAHRSKIDNTLQPYSVYLPKTFTASKKYPLIVALHGSGVDERGFFRGIVRRLYRLDHPLIAPKARGLSDWYLGDSGEDVFECIEHFRSLFPNIDKERIFLMGFSMGGYGTWRLGLIRPNYFKGLIILSGVLMPSWGAKRENILDMIDRIRDENIFIAHGDKDTAVPIANTRKAVEKLKALKANFEYIEIPGGGHGNYRILDKVIKWIKKFSEKQVPS